MSREPSEPTPPPGGWTCRACGEENFGDSRFCEACGRGRGDLPPSRPVAGRRPPWSHSPFEPAREAPDPRRGERPSAGGERPRVRMRYLHLGERVKAFFTRETARRIRRDTMSPLTAMLVAFLAWIVFRLVGLAPLLMLMRLLAFLMGPLGLVVVLAMAWTYARHRREIDAHAGVLRRRVGAFWALSRESARSLGRLARALGLLGRGTRGGEEESRGASRAPSQGTPVRGATVRILDEAEDEDDDKGHEA